MKCKFKKPTGDKCGLPTLRGSKYCGLHDPKMIPICFVKDFGSYKVGDSVFGIAKKKGLDLIKKNIAVKLDKKLYKDFLVKQLRN